MAAKTRKYIPSHKGNAEIDGENRAIQGWSAQDSADEVDLTTNDDNGWTLTESGCRSVTITCTIPLPAADNADAPFVVPGGIYAMTFDINGVPKYDGDFMVTSANLNLPIREAATLELTVKNYGDVEPVPVTPFAQSVAPETPTQGKGVKPVSQVQPPVEG